MSPITPPNVDRTVNDAIAAIRSGDKERGRTLLIQALRVNPHNEQAWLWMTAIAQTPEQQRECLERVLAINPQNKVARQGLKMFEMFQGSSVVSSYPKRSTLTRKEQLRLAKQTWGKEPTDRLLNRETIFGSIVLVICIGMAIAPLFTMIDWSEFVWRTSPFPFMSLLMYLLWLLLPLTWGINGGVNTIIGGVQSYRFSQALRSASAVADAPILDVWQELGFDDEPYIVAWELTASDGKGHTVRQRGSQRISKELYHLLQQRDTVRVRFVPHQPTIAALDSQWVAAIKQNAAG